MFFTRVNPMEDENCMEETPCDLKSQWRNTSSEYNTLVHFETRSRKRMAVLPNKVACSRPPRHTTSCLHREDGMHEDEG